MTKAEISGDFMEAAAPSGEDMVEVPETREAQPVESEQSRQDRNFKALRESQERLQRELEEERQMRLALEREFTQRNQPEPEPDPLADLSDDDWMTAKQARQLAARIAQEEARKLLEDDRRKIAEEELPKRLTSQYPDFESVVTEETVKQLRATEPEIARALGTIGDKYAQAVAAYKYIKALVPNAAETTADKERIEQNANQPKSLSSLRGQTPLGQAGAFERGLTPELKKQLLLEMEACAKQA